MTSLNKCAEQVVQLAVEHSLRRSRRNTVAAPCFSRGRSALALRNYAALCRGALALGTNGVDFAATVSTPGCRHYWIPLKVYISSARPPKPFM